MYKRIKPDKNILNTLIISIMSVLLFSSSATDNEDDLVFVLFSEFVILCSCRVCIAVACFGLWLSCSNRCTNNCEEPQTPSPGRPDSRRTKQPESLCRKRNKPDSTENSNMSSLAGFGNLLWRIRKPFRRVARKREELDILSPLYHVQQWHSYIKQFIYLIHSFIWVSATIW